MPVALTVAGSDSGGGAGIQADLKTFAALGVHGTSAITCLTAQNPRTVTAVLPATAAFVRQQLEAIFTELPPRAAKTGMLFSADIIRAVARVFEENKRVPLVVDPVMVATSGASLLKPSAESALKNLLLPRAALVTPNLDEAAILVGKKLSEPEDLRAAARKIHSDFGCAVLLKGGHLRDMSEAVDILFDGREEWMLSAPFVKGVSTHGTGCTYSAAVAAGLAHGLALADAVTQSKDYISEAIAQSQQVGRYRVLQHFQLANRKLKNRA